MGDGWPVFYVAHSSKDGWVVTKKGKKKPESVHDKKKPAVKKGRTLARRAKGTLKIKTKAGRIQATHRYRD